MGQKGDCPIPTPEGYLNHNKDNFQSFVDSVFENNPTLKGNDIVVLNAIYNAYISENEILGDAFGLWVKDIYPGFVADASITNPIKNLSVAENTAKLFVNDIIDDYADTTVSMPPLEEQEVNEGEVRDDGSHEHQSTVEVWADKIDSERFFRDRLFSAINKLLNESELAEILNFARDNTGKKGFEKFLDFMIEKYPDLAIPSEEVTSEDRLMASIFGEIALEKIQDPRKLQALKQVHISNDPVNKRTRKQKKYWVITNWDGEKVSPKGMKYLMEKPAMNLKTKMKEPESLPASFIDTSPALLPNGKKVGTQTEYMSLNDFVDLTEKDDGTWFGRDSHIEYSPKQLNDWLKKLLRGQNLTIATMKGGNSGTLILTKVDDIYYETLFPEKLIENLYSKFPEKFQEYLKKYNNDFNKSLINYYNDLTTVLTNEGSGRAKKEIAIFNAMETMGRKIAISRFKVYVEREYSRGFISEKGRDVMLENINNLPIKGTRDEKTGLHRPYIFMGEYLASVMARHEWLKAVIGKDYEGRGETLENIFNRMRQPASEGPMDRDGTNKVQLTINQNLVHYRNITTGERIDISQKVKGISENVDVDDGQMDLDSDSIAELTYALGRVAVMKYQHTPKEVKISQYLLEQVEDDNLPDNYFISKQMGFLAEPGLEIIDNETNKVLATVRKEDGEIRIYSGVGTEFPAQRINQILSLNEQKGATGRFDLKGKSHIIEEIPYYATRVVILPSTKSHIDAAMGTTWANSFNIDEPVFNKIREKLFEIYTNIMDEHLKLLHEARNNPDTMRKLVRYHYRVLDDATTQVQKLMNLSKYGVHHPAIRKIFRPSIFNQLVLQGALKARISINRTNPNVVTNGVSTTAKLKQDKLGRIKLDKNGIPEGVMVGAGNDRLFNYIQDKFIEYQFRTTDFDRKGFLAQSFEIRTRQLNKFLKDTEIIYDMQISRQPIQHDGGVVYRKILEILPDVGNSIVAHIQDVAYAWIGDGDGDTVNVSQLSSEKDTKELTNLLESARNVVPTFTSDLSKYKHAEPTNPLSYNGFTETLLSAVKYHNAQARVTNIKTIASIMELKLGDNPIILTDGVEIEVIKARDMVIADYAPLLDDYDTQDLPDFASIVDKNGKPWKEGAGEKYMKTMAAHARLDLLNAATDNVKEHLIGKMWGLTYDNMIGLMYKRKDGKPLEKEHIELLKKLNKFFNYSAIRNGRNKATQRKMTDSEFYAKTEGIYNFLKNPATGKEDILKNVIKLKNKKVGIESITISDKLVVDEVLLTRPYELMHLEANKLNGDSELPSYGHISGTPLSFTDSKDRNTHFATINGFRSEEMNVPGLNDEISNIINALPKGQKLTREVYNIAKEWVVKFDAAWRKQLNKGRNQKAKYQKEPTSQTYDYDKDMMEFMIPWEESFAKGMLRYGEAFRLAITYKMFIGIADIKRMNLFYEIDMINPAVYKTYMRIHETLFHAKDKNGVDLMSSQIAKTTTDQRITDVIDRGRCLE